MNIYLKKSLPTDSWARSTLLGNIDIDKHMLSSVNDDELFLMQINLEEYRKVTNEVLLPKTGLLYFFIKLNSYTPVIRYRNDITYNKKYDVRGNFNESLNLNYNIGSGYTITLSEQPSNIKSNILNINNRIDELEENEVILFEFHVNDTPLFSDQGNMIMYFIMKKEDLLSMKYENCRLIVKRL